MTGRTLGRRTAHWIGAALLITAAIAPARLSAQSAPPAQTTPPAGSPHAMPGHGTSAPAKDGKKEIAPFPIPPLPPTPAKSADLSKARQLKQVTVVVRHRVFANFAELMTLKSGEEQIVGDTDYSVRLVEYVPDFTMDIGTGRILSRSDQPNNPAFRFIVKQKGVPNDTTWALMHMTPHFGRKSMLSFQVVKVEFTSGKPIEAQLPATKPTAAKDGKGK